MELSDYFGDWLKVIDEKELISISKRLHTMYQHLDVNPEYGNIFRAFKECSYDNCKVIMLFQDCYFQKGISIGLALGNKLGTTKLSPSLETFIYSLRAAEGNHSLLSDFDITMESLEEQGVLMLNSALTVQVNKPGSHAALWMPFTSKFLLNMSIINPGIVYVLFGADAQYFEKFINPTNNLILKTYHPAYYARNDRLIPARIFRMINDWVAIQHSCKIDWFKNNKYGREDKGE